VARGTRTILQYIQCVKSGKSPCLYEAGRFLGAAVLKEFPMYVKEFAARLEPGRAPRAPGRADREPRGLVDDRRPTHLEHRIADPGEQIAPPGSRTTADKSICEKPGKQATRALLQLTNNDARIDARGSRITARGSHTASTDPGLEDRGSRASHNQDNRQARQLEPDPGDRRPRAIQARSRAYTNHAPGQHDRPSRRAQARSHQTKRKGSEEPFRDRLETCSRTSPRTRSAPRDRPRRDSSPAQTVAPQTRTNQPGRRPPTPAHPRPTRQSCPTDRPQWH